MNIDVSNAHCGPWIKFPDHTWLRVGRLMASTAVFVQVANQAAWRPGESERTRNQKAAVRSVDSRQVSIVMA